MFVNLHVHSDYSHDGISKVKNIVKKAVENEQPAVALTDHGSMAGVIDLYRCCKDKGIKPIFGNEFYICRPNNTVDIRDSSNKSYNHIVVLAKNITGYKNLLHLTTLSNKNYYYHPRIDEELLFKHSEGLIVLNGHIGTSLADIIFFNKNGVSTSTSDEEIDSYLWPNHEEEFLNIVNKYKGIFGDDFYVECQLFDSEDKFQQALGKTLFRLAQKHNVNCVGTGDSHYINPNDAKFHKTFCAIKHNTKVKDLADIRYFSSGLYGLITNEHAQNCYPKQLIDATMEIYEKVEAFDITRKQQIPNFPVKNKVEHLRQLVVDKCPKAAEYQQRLEHELSEIRSGDMEGYFLIVADYIGWANSKGMLTGVGRGSAASSLVGYLLGITRIDPIEYGLLFSRFYSAERGSLPDYDIDFPASCRDSVIDYIRETYGDDRVCGVTTFSTLQGKGALKDVLRVHNVGDFTQINKISEVIPGRELISDKLAEFKKQTGSDSIIMYVLVNQPDLLKDYCYINDNQKLCGEYAEYFEIAIGLEGCIKASSKHASAIIISDVPITEYAPLVKDKSSDNLICEFDMDSFEYAGFVKFDILGLRTLDQLMEVNNVLAEIGIEI